MVTKSVNLVVGLKDNATEAAQNMSKSLKGVAASITSAFKVAAGVSAAAIGGITAFASSYAQSADELAKSAARIGISVEELSALGHAAELSGASLGSLEEAAKAVSVQMDAAANGSADAMQIFSSLGVKIHDSSGQLKSFRDILPEMADGLSKIESPTRRAAVAQRALGDAGFQLSILMAQGGDAIRAAAEEAESLGKVLSGQAARDAEAYRDSVTRLSAVFQGLRNTIGAALIPAFTELSDSFKDVVSGALPQLRDGFKNMAIDFVAIGEIFRQVFSGLTTLFKTFIKAIQEDWVSVFSALFNILVEFGEQLSSFIGTIAIGIWNPLLTSFSAIIDAISSLWDDALTGELTTDIVAKRTAEAFEKASRAATEAMTQTGEALTAQWAEVLDNMTAAINEGPFVDLIVNIEEAYATAIDQVSALLQGFRAEVKEVTEEGVDPVDPEKLNAGAEFFKAYLGDLGTGLKDFQTASKGAFNSFATGVGSAFASAKVDGKKFELSMQDILKSITKSVITALIRILVFQTVAAIFTGGASLGATSQALGVFAGSAGGGAQRSIIPGADRQAGIPGPSPRARGNAQAQVINVNLSVGENATLDPTLLRADPSEWAAMIREGFIPGFERVLGEQSSPIGSGTTYRRV